MLRHLVGFEMQAASHNGWFTCYRVIFVSFSLLMIALSGLSGQSSGFSGMVASLLNMYLYVVPLFTLCIGALAVTGQRENGCDRLLDTYPVTPWQRLLGRYLGLLFSFGGMALLGILLPAALLLVMGILGSLRLYALLVLAVGLMIVTFSALALVVGARASGSPSAIGMCLLVWFSLLILYEPLVAILCLLLPGSLSAGIVGLSLALNPAEATRVAFIVFMGDGHLLGDAFAWLDRLLLSPPGSLLPVGVCLLFSAASLALAYRSRKHETAGSGAL